MPAHFAKKSLGQNFLKSTAIVDDIVEAGEVNTTDTILEIGPGKGVLTEALLKKAGKVIAIEKDDRLISELSAKFAAEIKNGHFSLLHADALELEPSKNGLEQGKYKLIANIPYYITGEIIRKFMETEASPTLMVLMVQKEVAERIARSEKESILSLSVKVFGLTLYVQTVKAGNFDPIPSVDSAILKISNISKDFFTQNSISIDQFFAILKAGFAHKRKFLSKNLEKVAEPAKITEIFAKLGISPQARAEDLTLDIWKSLTTYFAQK
jgi:16S rRNA (adenine1518-N6/adenine1519-N6)-dimethyltransferase